MVAVMERKLYTVKEVADELRVHEETVRRWIRDGKMAAVRMGGSRGGFRIKSEEVERIRDHGIDGSSKDGE